ncbi:hypothetical protein LV779_14025 [Streptomyces thinghirensis]|nr:hypothetical protein [Streptomyces thinghirensis]
MTGRVEAEAEGHDGRVLDCAWSSDGDFVTVGGDGESVLWDAGTAPSGAGSSGIRGVSGVRGFPDGARMASAGEDGVVRVHGSAHRDVLTELVTHEGHALGCAFSLDGARLPLSGTTAG